MLVLVPLTAIIMKIFIRRTMQDINKFLRDLEKKINKDNEERIEKEIIPQLRDELREENEAEIEALEEQIEFYQNQLEMFGAQKCTNLQRMACVAEQRQIMVLYLIANGWITDKSIMKSDFWNGAPISKRPRGGRTIHP